MKQPESIAAAEDAAHEKARYQKLTERERAVLQFVASGFTAPEIGEKLLISPKTVDTYRAGLMRKLNVHDLVGLVKFAIERNLTTTSGPR